ncbi:MAG TPA: glycosyltransferase [Candidatus Methylomirabilis sp.]|nr:glycosyltransferase [Candidatus Methylomirabilis sp.]
MRILFATARNPRFATITEYIERAVRLLGHDLSSFDDRNFVLPGRVREAITPLDRFDLSLLNRRLRHAVRQQRPDLLLCAGGERILPETVEAARATGTRTALWTTDPVKPGDPRIALAPHFDLVFCAGTEMIEALRGSRLRKEPRWLPFACDPELHRPLNLSSEEKSSYGCGIAFVGSLHPELYPTRIAMLEALAEFDLGVWGPGGRDLPASSSIRSKIRGEETRLEEWTRIYSASKILLCAHYGGPGPVCRQASPRVYEILACGGFLLCDNQPDVQVLFEDGRDLVIFRNLSELREKAFYYLDRDQERRGIAARGREKVLAAHTYQHRVAELMSMVTGARWEPPPR